mgnify:CR=1 FL=1
MKQVMKKLCAFMVLLAVSVGAWAADAYDGFYLDRSTWFANQYARPYAYVEAQENVCKITLTESGKLSDAIQKINELGTYADCKMVSISTNVAGQQLNSADISALRNLEFETIDLQYTTYEEDGVSKAFTFSNSNVVNLILPDNWTKAEVKAAGEAIQGQLGAAFSVGTHDDGNTSVTAYVNKGGTLRTAILHAGYDNKANTKLNEEGFNQDHYDPLKVKHLYLSGHPSAIDFSYHGIFDEAGHVKFDKEPDETTDAKLGAIGGGTRQRIGTEQYGPWTGGSMQFITLDLEDAEIEDSYCEDLTLSLTIGSDNGIVGSSTKFVVLPKYSGFHTIPADFLNISNSVSQICIPGNITTIRTRAFAAAPLNHVWTTVGPDGALVVDEEGKDATVYDNGVCLTGSDELKYGYQDVAPTQILYGTYTLPAGLELIESRAFANTEPRIKDVYVLNVKAPECHVDAFSTGAYTANNSMNGKPVDGIITRDAYQKDVNAGKWVTMLHYPRQSTTPDIQRYTDVTRDYSIATGLRDGKGATIYFPTQNEFNRAYFQGTFGYLWNAWDPTRDENNTVTNPGLDMTEGYSQSGQQTANQAYIDNKAEGIVKNDRSFYDVTDLNNLDQPAGLKPYYETIWESKQLYPQAETTGTGTYRTVEVKDENGNYVYEVDNTTPGEYTQIGTYVENSEGGFVMDYTVEENEEGSSVKNYVYVEAEDGDFYYDAGYIEDANGNLVKDYTYEVHDDSDGTKGGYYIPYNYYNTYWNAGGAPTEGTYYVRIPLFELDENGNYGIDPYNSNQWSTDSWITPKYKMTGYTYQEWDGVSFSFNTCGGVWSGAELYTMGNSYMTYTSSVGDVTTYDRVPVSPVVYRAYNSETDAGETLYSEYDNGYVSYSDEVGSVTRYNYVWDGSYREYTEADGDATRYNVTENGFRAYNEETDADAKRYSLDISYVADATSISTDSKDNPYITDTENQYAISTEEVELMTVSKAYDYRGWHQFVLTSYAANSKVPFVPYRSYISDNDWWTICLPFDLTRAELIKMFGTEGGERLPYLSKLTYVVRDVENKDITLNFSKNLLEYKEELVGDSELHGKVSDTPGGVQDDDIVLHKGVPYLIRPFLTADADGSIKRQFDIQSTNTEGDLYDRIKTSQELSGSDLNQIIYNGEYTVPAYVINNSSSLETVNTSDVVSFNMGDNTVFEYDNKEAKITYNGEEVDAQISSDYCYTFVGSFFLSLMPKYSYFLGWDSKKGKAAFWYNAVPNTTEWTWNNETGIILPNFVTAEQEIKITAATNLNNPARWVINLKNGDDFPKTTSVKNHVTAMDFGGSAKLFDGEATVIIKVDNEVIDPSTIHFNNKGVYSLSGQYMGNSVEGLQKGIYIVNGKKMVIK